MKVCEERPCKTDFKLENPDSNSESFISLRSKFDGIQIPSQWMIQREPEWLPKSKQKFHSY